jgi:Zn-finger nucleic acid-binding protein
MDVESLNCPNCGAGVASDSTLCEFCKTRLKTIGCPKCLGLMFVGSKFCEHCGAIAAPVEVSLDGKQINCPRCKQKLETLKIDDVGIHGCTGCDGLWVGVGTFETICANTEKQSAIFSFLSKRTVHGQPFTKVNYVPCPDCEQLMNRNNFARSSGVIVDICKQHGVWFDSDELPAIIGFIQQGGLEHAREREKMEIHEERSKLRDEQRQSAAQELKFGGAKMWQTDEENSIRSFIQNLFE